MFLHGYRQACAVGNLTAVVLGARLESGWHEWQRLHTQLCLGSWREVSALRILARGCGF